jgi:hypothetical protein
VQLVLLPWLAGCMLQLLLEHQLGACRRNSSNVTTQKNSQNLVGVKASPE